MNAFVRNVCLALALAFTVPAQAAIKVLATTSDWGALTTELGGDKVNVYTATSALQDVHRVDAKPSLVAAGRRAVDSSSDRCTRSPAEAPTVRA